jgi:hypothetical protein
MEYPKNTGLMPCKCIVLILFVILQNANGQTKPTAEKDESRDEFDRLVISRKELSIQNQALQDSIDAYKRLYSAFNKLQAKRDSMRFYPTQMGFATGRLEKARNEMQEARRAYEDLENNHSLRDLEVELKRKRTDSVSMQARFDSLARATALTRRDLLVRDASSGTIDSIYRTMSGISDGQIRSRILQNPSVLMTPLESMTTELLKREKLYDSGYARMVHDNARSIKELLKGNTDVESACGQIIRISDRVTDLSDSKKVLSLEYEKKRNEAALISISEKIQANGYDLIALNEETERMRSLLNGYCRVNAEFWAFYNRSVNPIPATTLKMLNDDKFKLDREYRYLHDCLEKGKRNSQSGVRLTERKPIPECK